MTAIWPPAMAVIDPDLRLAARLRTTTHPYGRQADLHLGLL